MKHSKDNWIKALKQAVTDVEMPPTSGLPCAIASVRIIRDGILADLKANAKLKLSAEIEEAIKASVLELIRDLGNPECKMAGFASNASAAAKAAELETSKSANLAAKLVG